MKSNSLSAGLWRRFWSAKLACILASASLAFAADKFNSVYFCEVLVDNRDGIIAEDGSHSGWIELYNGGSDTVNLAGSFLSDSPTNLTEWRFPRVYVLPGNYLLIFASGTGRTNDLAHLHTNFRLNKEGGELLLVTPGTNVVSHFVYPKSSPDVAYGRVRGEPAILGSFSQPTPGKPNQSSGSGFAPNVIFSHPSGSFTTSIVVNLGCATNQSTTASTNLVIRYTLDGRFPTSTSPLYREPLVLTNTACIRARAYQEGLLPGPPSSETYLSLSPKVFGFHSTLPVLVMDTFGQDRPTSLRSSSVQLSFYEPVDGKTSLRGQPALATRGGFHARGSSSAQKPPSPGPVRSNFSRYPPVTSGGFRSSGPSRSMATRCLPILIFSSST